MTLRELLEKIEPTGAGRVPTAASLREGDSPVQAEQSWSDGSRLRVYQNGYALFETGRKCTVFRVDYCGGYRYFNRTGQEALSEEYFAEAEWWVRLLMEAEDRMTHNRKVQSELHEVPYEGDAGQESRAWIQHEDPLLENYVQKELLELAFSGMTERQREVLEKYHIKGYGVQRIADEYGISHQAVSSTLSDIRKKLKKLQKKFE
jgi:RNA polymerase sigma factor (sigma-70 family)